MFQNLHRVIGMKKQRVSQLLPAYSKTVILLYRAYDVFNSFDCIFANTVLLTWLTNTSRFKVVNLAENLCGAVCTVIETTQQAQVVTVVLDVVGLTWHCLTKIYYNLNTKYTTYFNSCIVRDVFLFIGHSSLGLARLNFLFLMFYRRISAVEHQKKKFQLQIIYQ